MVAADKLNGHTPIRLDQVRQVADIQLVQADLVNLDKPSRHDSKKLAACLVKLLQ
jgi:hypothetical protein